MSKNQEGQSLENARNIASTGDNADMLRVGILDAPVGGGSIFKMPETYQHGHRGLDGLLPSVDLTGFDQSSDTSTGLKRLWHKVENIFGHEETLGDQVKDKVVKNMSPDEKKQYEDEQKAIEKYEAEVRRISMLSTMQIQPLPEMPNTPMHAEVQRRIQQAEQKIADDVRAHMTPEERRTLDKQMKQYEDGVTEARTIHNPLGTGEGFKPLPEPGDAVKEYWRKIKEATERDVQH